MPLTGFLKVSGTQESPGGQVQVVPGTLGITVSESKTLPNIWRVTPLSWIILLPLALSLFVVFIISSFDVLLNTLSRKKEKVRIGSTLGTGLTPSLKFGEGGSWASMTAVVSAIFTAFSTAAIYPEELPYFSKEEMAGFILFFAALVGFAPVIYNLARRPKPVVAKDDASRIVDEAQVQGYVWTLLGASALILGALLGQLLVAGLLTMQFGAAMAPVGKLLLRLILAISAFYAARYVYRGIRLTLEEKSERKEKVVQASGQRQEVIDEAQLGQGMPSAAEGYKTNERELTML